MRKCINLEDQPGFEQIQSPVLMQAIDRGLMGFSGTGVIDWGYDLPKPREIPVKRGGDPPVKEAPKVEPIDPNLPHKVVTGGDPYWDYLFNRWAGQSARKIINRFPNTKITKGGRYAGSHNSYNGPWSEINTPYGYGGLDVQVLFHEYGHALDNIIGYATGSFERDTESGENSPDRGRMETSLQLFGPMKADGEKLGLVFDDSAYWDFIEKYGISYTHTRGRQLNIAKGSKRDNAEPKMKPGDHWLLMKYMVDESKKNVTRIKNTKIPDPVKLKRAEAELNKINKLYDKHIARHKKVVEIIKELYKIEASMAKSMPDFVEYGGGDMVGSFTDILAALTGDEVADKQMHDPLSGGDINGIGAHGFGYFTQRQGHRGSGRMNHNGRNHSAMYGRRAEIWAELFQFWAGNGGKTKNKEMWKFAQKLFPQTTNTMVNALTKAQTVKLQGSYYNKYKNINVNTHEAKGSDGGKLDPPLEWSNREQQSETNPRTDLPWKTGGKEGDLYIQRIGTNAGRVTKSRTSVNDIAISFDKNQLLPDYAYYLLTYLQPKIQARARGTAQQGIRKSDIDEVLIEYFRNA